MPFEYNKNLTYSPWRLVRRPLQTYAVYNSVAKRWADGKTGKFIRRSTALRKRRMGTYWNRIRSIVRAAKTKSFANAEQELKLYRLEYPTLTLEEKAAHLEELWGYWR